MVKIKISGHPEIKVSPFAFGTTFSTLNMIDNPTEEDIEDSYPQVNATVYDCENNPYVVMNKVIDNNNIVIELLTQES
jgi:hypothetical protein